LIGIVRGFLENKRFKFSLKRMILLFWFFGPLLVQALIAKTFTARYILFTVPVLIVFVGFGGRIILKLIENRLHKQIGVVVVGLLLIPALIFNYHLWFSPSQANFPKDERRGYLEDWTAGWGNREIADYLQTKYKNENVVVGTEGFFGTLPNGLKIYLADHENITVIGTTYPIKKIPDSLVNAKEAGDEVYLVVNRSRYKIEGQEEDQLELVKSYSKPGGDELLFFKIKID